MLPLIVIGVIVGLPVLLALIFQVNAVFVFMGIAAGYLLQMSLSGSVDLLAAMIIRGSDTMVIARIVLFTLPVVLTLLFLRKTAGKSLVFQFIPLLFSGMMFGILMLSIMTQSFSESVYDSQYGGNIRSSADLVTGIAVASNIILAITLFKSQGGHKKHH